MDLAHTLKRIRAFLKTYHYFSPINLKTEKEKFFKSKNYNPQLSYPSLSIKKLDEFKEKLSTLILPDDSDIASVILRKKVDETNLKLMLFSARGTTQINNASKKLYQINFDKRSLTAAEAHSKKEHQFKPQENLSAKDTAYTISEYLKSYDAKNWQVMVSKKDDFYFQILPKKRRISISHCINWDGAGLDSVLAHEVDGHVVRAINSRKQELPYSENFPFYIKTEEGLACYLGDYLSENGEVSLTHHAIKYLGGYFAQTHSFREIFDFFIDRGFTTDLAFQRTLRLKRGFCDTSIPGCFAREAMYYEGMLEVKDYLESGGDVKNLFAGKIGLADLDSVPVPKNQVIPKRLKAN